VRGATGDLAAALGVRRCLTESAIASHRFSSPFCGGTAVEVTGCTG